MYQILKKMSAFMGYIVFFILFFSGYNFGTPFEAMLLYPLILKSLFGAVVFWFASLIVGDIIVKGVVADIEKEKLEPLEGGFEQHIFTELDKTNVKVIKKNITKEQQ